MAERKRNRLGSIFLLAAIVGFLAVEFQPWLPLVSLRLYGGLNLKALLESFFEASLAGAFADWFAVTALFKDPLGIPFAHTNILAKNKDVIADAIPRFLTGFVTQPAIRKELGKIDYASKIAEALSGESREELHAFLKAQAAQLSSAYGAAAGGGDEAKKAALARFAGDVLSFVSARVDAAASLASLLGWARKERFDQRALEAVAQYAFDSIGRNRSKLIALLTPIVKRNAGWQGLFIGPGTIERFLSGIQDELSDIKADKTNEFRLFVLSAISAYASKLSGAPGAAERERIGGAFRGALASEENFVAGSSSSSPRCSPASARTFRETMGASSPRSSGERKPWQPGSRTTPSFAGVSTPS